MKEYQQRYFEATNQRISLKNILQFIQEKNDCEPFISTSELPKASKLDIYRFFENDFCGRVRFNCALSGSGSEPEKV